MKNNFSSLKERLNDWTDWDGAIYELGACLGFWPDFGRYKNQEDPWHGVKGIIWTNNPLNNAMFEFLDSLVEVGVLESNGPGTEYRWNTNYEIK